MRRSYLMPLTLVAAVLLAAAGSAGVARVGADPVGADPVGADAVGADEPGPAAYAIDWSTVDGGGGSSTGGGYTLVGTIGQPDPGRLAGGSLVLSGGFWQPAVALQLDEGIYLPLIVRR